MMSGEVQRAWPGALLRMPMSVGTASVSSGHRPLPNRRRASLVTSVVVRRGTRGEISVISMGKMFGRVYYGNVFHHSR
jgi:hypothetical protein